MTKLLTIDVDYDKNINEVIFIVTVIANKQENILILKDLIADQGEINGFKCYGCKLHHTKQYCYPVISELAVSGQLYVRCTKEMELLEAMNGIAKILLNFIQ